MRIRRLPRDPISGIASVEFALIAPILIMAVLSTTDIGLMIHKTSEIDQALRNGAEAALSDPDAALSDPKSSRVKAILAAVDSTGARPAETVWTVKRYCSCSGTSGAPTTCTSTCSGSRPPAIYYDIKGERTYSGIFLRNRNLIRTASVQVR